MPRLNINKNQQITNFFQTKKNLSESQPVQNIHKKNLVQDFYKQCLTESSEICTKECTKSTLKQQIIDIQEKLKKVEIAYETYMKVLQKKDEKIKILQAEIDLLPIATEQKEFNENVLFDEFIDVFKANDLKKICSVGVNKRDDSSFIHEAVKGLYSDDFEPLNRKSATGRGYLKEPLTPQKKLTLENIYSRRFDIMKLPSIERAKREKK